MFCPDARACVYGAARGGVLRVHPGLPQQLRVQLRRARAPGNVSSVGIRQASGVGVRPRQRRPGLRLGEMHMQLRVPMLIRQCLPGRTRCCSHAASFTAQQHQQSQSQLLVLRPQRSTFSTFLRPAEQYKAPWTAGARIPQPRLGYRSYRSDSNHNSNSTNSKSRLRSRRFWQSPHFSTTVKMSSVVGGGFGSAALYAVVSMSTPGVGYGKPEDAEGKSHHLKGGKGFMNPWDSFRDFTPWKMGLNLIGRKLRGEVHIPDTTPPTVPVHKPTFLPSRETPALRATWLGHACYYVEFPSGLRVLFDPVFEDCCSPINLNALKRFTPPPCEIEDLPVVDLVVISHNHYDHLSYPTIQRIRKKFPNAHFFAPLGNKKWFTDSNVPATNVTELDWWDVRGVGFEVQESKSAEKVGAVKDVHVVAGNANADKDSGTGESTTQNPSSTSNATHTMTATISALPCQHVSARGPFDKCKTLWASWSVESGGSKVYFAGDTGYRSVPRVPAGTDDYSAAYAHLPTCPAFSQIGTHRGPFDLGLIPIGAYEPRFIMSPMHANPKDSVNIFLDTKCKKALGMHWGTWVLTEEDVMEPPVKLREALREKGIDEEGVFGVLDIGSSWVEGEEVKKKVEGEGVGDGKGA